MDAGGVLADGAAILAPGVPGGAGLAIKASRAVNNVNETTTLYRAVSKAELDDIGVYGLRNIAGGYETSKLFATTLEDATQFGKNNFKLDGVANHLIQVDVPSSIMKNSTQFKADSMDVVSIPANMLDFLNGTPLNYSPLR